MTTHERKYWFENKRKLCKINQMEIPHTNNGHTIIEIEDYNVRINILILSIIFFYLGKYS